MMKDTSYGMPMRVSDKQERGFYIFFDVTNWRRERVGLFLSSSVAGLIVNLQREILLNYDHLDQRHAPAQPGPPL